MSGPALFHGAWVPVAGSSEYLAVTTSDQDITTGMLNGSFYLFTSTADCLVLQGTGTVTVTDADGAFLIPRGLPVLFQGSRGAVLSVKGESAGKATLQKVVKAL